MNARRLFAALVLAAGTLALHAQDHPMEAPGFAPNKIYDFHDVDSVNTFNGNLIVRVPIGPVFHVNGNLSYSLALHYNSHAWHFMVDTSSSPPGGVPDDPACKIGAQNPKFICYWALAEPSLRSNAAFGWTLSLGRLFGPGDPLNTSINQFEAPWNAGFTYEDPDGATHPFPYAIDQHAERAGVLLSKDGSYLRLKEDADLAHVYIASSDGITREFHKVSGKEPQWQLAKISDATGNHVDITYDGFKWIITDVARTITVQFADGTPLYTKLVSVTMPSPEGNGQTVTYKIDTAMEDLQQPLGVSSLVSPIPAISVPVLTAVNPPDPPAGQPAFEKPYTFTNVDTTPAYDGQSNIFTGCLRRMTIPTGAVYVWDYTQTDIGHLANGALSPTAETPVEVLTRTVTDSVTKVDSTWQYSYAVTYYVDCPPNHWDPRERVNTILRPDGTREVHHYNAFHSNQCLTDTVGEKWSSNDFSLPFTQTTAECNQSWYPNGSNTCAPHSTARQDPTDATQKQYLSSEVFDGSGNLLQSHYVTYDGDQQGLAGDPRPNARVSAEVVYAEETTTPASGQAWMVCPPLSNCPGRQQHPQILKDIFSATHRYNYRQFGNYATTVTTGNYPTTYDALDAQGLSNRTSFQNYPQFPDLNTLGTWAPNVPDGGCVVDGDVHSSIHDTTNPTDAVTPALQVCSGITNSFITLFDYDQQHNLLKGKRVLAGSGLGSTDLLVHYLYEDTGDSQNLGSNGNLTAEAYEGGDNSGLGTTSNFPYSSSTGFTIIHHQHSYTIGAVNGLKTYYDGRNWVTSDFTIDAPSGLISSSRDASGLQTSYSFDQLGRLVGITPPGGATTTYTYNAKDTPVSIVATTTTGSTVLKSASYDYDGLGRLWHEKSNVNGWSTRTTRYDTMSRVVAVSPLQANELACFDAQGTPDPFCTQTTYDPLGRVHNSTNPDGFTTSFVYEGGARTTRTQDLGNSNSATTTEINDGLGRLFFVRDPVHTTGTYSYDAADHLTKAVVGDDSGHTQTRKFGYDNRGFLMSESHPENGQVLYSYDQRGHMLTKGLAVNDAATPSAFDLAFAYDTAERLLTVKQPLLSQLMKSFQYYEAEPSGSADHFSGKLTVATRHNYQAAGDVEVSETYHYYDPAGRLSDRTTTICVAPDPVNNPTVCNPKQSLTQSTTYNELGLTASTTYPTCTGGPVCLSPAWPSISRTYVEGRLTKVQSPLGTVAAMTYSENEMLNTIVHGSGVAAVTDTIEKDDRNQLRPKSITVAGPAAACTAPQWLTPPPSDQNVASGSSVSLTASASGSPAPTYEWLSGSGSGATHLSYGQSSPSLTAPATYTLKVSNSCGVLTDPFTLSASSCPMSWQTKPPDQFVLANNPHPILTAQANGTGPMTYNWVVAGSTVSSVSTWQPFINATTTCTLTVTDGCNPADSLPPDTFTLTVCPTPTWQPQLGDQHVAPSSSPTFLASVNGTAPFTYKWVVAGATVSTVSTWQPSIGTSSVTCTVTVTDACGNQVTPDTFTVSPDVVTCITPAITTQPLPSVMVALNQQPVPPLYVMASGTNPTYEWQEVNSSDPHTLIPGQTYAPVVTRSIKYHAIATACGQTATSDEAVLTVPLPAPSGLTALPNGANAILSWSALGAPYVPLVTRYEIWRNVAAEGWGTAPIATVPASALPTWTDTTVPEGLVQYEVRAVEVELLSSSYATYDEPIMNFGAFSDPVNFMGICSFPDITTYPVSSPPAVAYNTTLTPALNVIVSNPVGVTYKWLEVGNPTTVLSPTASFAPVVTHSGWYYVDAANACGSKNSGLVTIRLSIPAPANLVATAGTGGGNVTVTWTPVSGNYVDHYEVWRTLSGPTGWASVATVSSATSSWTDTNLASGQAAAYRVRAVEDHDYGGGGLLENYGLSSNVDVATRFPFSAIPSTVSFAPLEQARLAINAVRVAAGQSTQTWSQLLPTAPPPQVGAIVTAAHINALRSALKNALSVGFNITLPPFTDDGAQGLAAGTPIKLVHITELQGRTQ